MGDTKLIVKAAVLSTTALLLAGCSAGTTPTASDKPEWPISVSQSSEVTPEIAAALDNTVPQYKKDSYTAALLPLGESVEGDKKIIKFALKANLPDNCLTEDNSHYNDAVKDAESCLSFIVIAAGPLVDDAERGYKYRPQKGAETTYLKNIKGNTVLEVTAPVDAELSIGTVLADGEIAMVNLSTGEDISPKDEASATPTPTAAPTASGK